MLSMRMSVAIVPVNVSPCWVVALSRVWVMRIGMMVSGVKVMFRKAGGAGGGGGGGGSSCGGGGGGGATATCGAGISAGGVSRTTGAGAGFDLGAGLFFGITGVGGGGGRVAAVTEGARA